MWKSSRGLRGIGCGWKCGQKSQASGLTYECVKKSDLEPVVAGYRREVARLQGEIQRMRGHDRDAHLELFRMKSFLRRRGLVAEYEVERDREDAAQ